MTPPLEVDFKPSLPAGMVLIVLHIAAAAGASVLLPFPAALLVGVGLILAACSAAALVWPSRHRAVRGLKIDSDGSLHLHLRTGDWCAARLKHAGLLIPSAMALLFRDEAGATHPVLAIRAPRAVEAMRRLRVWAVNAAGFTSEGRGAGFRHFS